MSGEWHLIFSRWVYLIGMFAFTISSVLCAVSVNFAMFYVFRMLQAIFGSCPLGLVGGSISDIAEPHERGKLVSLYILSLVVSTPIGTVAGGFIDQYLDFRFIFYILTVYGGITTVITFLFFEETLYSIDEKTHIVTAPLRPQDGLIKAFAFNPVSPSLL